VRLQQTGHSHFITFTCYHRLRHLSNAQVCSAVLRALENTRKRYGLLVYGFVLMPEHVHLVLGEPERGTLAQALQSLKSASARMTGRWCRTGGAPFWQARYYDRYMRDYDEFSQKLRYIHRNPVQCGLCASPEQWPWSSFRHYSQGTPVGVGIESEWTARGAEI
jgi:putative transposase